MNLHDLSKQYRVKKIASEDIYGTRLGAAGSAAV